MVYLWLIAVSRFMKYDFEPGKRRPQVNAASEMLELETPRLQVNKVLFKSLRTQSSLASRDIPAFEPYLALDPVCVQNARERIGHANFGAEVNSL